MHSCNFCSFYPRNCLFKYIWALHSWVVPDCRAQTRIHTKGYLPPVFSAATYGVTWMWVQAFDTDLLPSLVSKEQKINTYAKFHCKDRRNWNIHPTCYPFHLYLGRGASALLSSGNRQDIAHQNLPWSLKTKCLGRHQDLRNDLIFLYGQIEEIPLLTQSQTGKTEKGNWFLECPETDTEDQGK